MTESARPLAGVTVVDLTTFLSGPFCTQLLADMGATVIKVEPPVGDSSRTIPPYFVGDDSAYFLASNRSKRSIAIDLKNPAGLEVVRRLIEDAQVVIENFRPDVAARLGLDPAVILAGRPDLTWASISGFGQTSPWRDRPAYDMVVQALSGAMSLTGEPGRPAVRLGLPVGDLVAGMFAAIGICSSLVAPQTTGSGRHIDVAMLDSLIALQSYQGVYSMISGETPPPQGARHDSIPTYRSFMGGDGREFVVTANTERMWQGLCAAIDMPELVDDTRFASGGLRLQHRVALWELLESAFNRKPASEWVEALQARQVPAALIANVPEALADAKAAGRDMVLNLDDGADAHVSVLGNPVKFVGVDEPPTSYPPRLSQHAKEILAAAGYDAAESAKLFETGAVLPPR